MTVALYDPANGIDPGAAGGSVNSVAAADTTMVVGGTVANPTVRVGTIAQSQVTTLVSDLAARQPLTTTLTTLGGLDGTTAGAIAADGGGTWIKKTYAQFKTALALVAADVGLGNVTNAAQLLASNLDTDVNLAANSDTKVASQKATKAYVDTHAATTSYTSAGTGAVTRTAAQKWSDFISVKDFGATGDGVTDDTTSITNADTYARSVGGICWFPAGTYLVSQLVLQTESNWWGAGRNGATIKLKNSSNLDLIYGVNSNACWGSGAPTGFANGATLRNLTLDGNKANNTSGSGIAFYGPRPVFEDLFIKNCAEHGMRTEYTDVANGTDTFAMEGWFSNIRIDTCGKHGWWNNGPHDSVAINIIVIDASQLTANTYDAFYYDTKGNGRNIGNHGWTRGASTRMRASLNILQGGGSHEFTGGCNFEGGFTANVILSGQNCVFDPSTRYYAAWNGVNIIMGNSNGCTQNTVMGKISDPGGGRPASVGLQLGNTAADWVANNYIDLHMQSQEAGNYSFNANYGGANNRIRGKCFNATTATIVNSPFATDDMDVMVVNSNGVTHINNKVQVKKLAVGSNTSASWTFPYAFTAAPVIAIAPVSPGANLTTGIWVSSLSATSVTIQNLNTTTVTVHIIARDVN